MARILGFPVISSLIDRSVHEIEFLWMNEDDGDFVCHEDLEVLEKRHKEKLISKRFCDINLYQLEFTSINEILECISPVRIFWSLFTLV